MKTLRALAVLALAACDGNIDDGGPLLAVTQRASLGQGAVEGNANSSQPSTSADGRFVAFVSSASNLVPGDTNGVDDVFVRDMLTGAVVRASLADDESEADGHSSSPAISADGRFVAFLSLARNLTATADNNGTNDVYFRDLQDGTTVLVSASTANAPVGNCGGVAISPDGGFVAFQTTQPAEDLQAGLAFADGSGFNDVFLRQIGGGTVLISAGTSDGVALNEPGNQASVNPAISSVNSNGMGGLWVAFQSRAGNLAGAGGASAFNHVYRRGFPSPSLAGTSRLSVTPLGGPGNHNSFTPSMSADGRFVAFSSAASDLLGAGLDTNGREDVFLRDVDGSTTALVSVHTLGSQGSESSRFPRVSADGRMVAFESDAPNLVDDDTNLARDVFVRHLGPAATVRVSVRTYGEQTPPFGTCDQPALSADGRFVAFRSAAGTLVDGDLNGFEDVLLRGPLR